MNMPRRTLLVIAGLALIGVGVWLALEQTKRRGDGPSQFRPSAEGGGPSSPSAGDSLFRDERPASPRAAPAQAAGASALPGPIEALLRQPQHQRPRMREVPAFDAGVEAELIRRYRAIPSLGEKQHLLRMLAYHGGEKSVDLFVEAMTVECAGKELTRAENIVMSYLPQLMGVLARRHESARRFLWAATEPEFWAAHRKWERDDGPRADTVMAGSALEGLALTGTEEVRELLASYRTRPDYVLRWDLEAAIVDAVYIHRRVTEHGLQHVMDEILYRAGDLTDFRAWSETDEGREWRQWSVNMRRQSTLLRQRTREAQNQSNP
jgi:hypothetical protein